MPPHHGHCPPTRPARTSRDSIQDVLALESQVAAVRNFDEQGSGLSIIAEAQLMTTILAQRYLTTYTKAEVEASFEDQVHLQGVDRDEALMEPYRMVRRRLSSPSNLGDGQPLDSLAKRLARLSVALEPEATCDRASSADQTVQRGQEVRVRRQDGLAANLDYIPRLNLDEYRLCNPGDVDLNAWSR
ncbi:uncharacterized protein MONBRDRAFT_22866 [Monosiga brevicollis MX1]|uniref:Uncharacterized protein n=1 Tax=Monosiga brevicollis TaxID=81824 RepID=A9USA9_MONBE|nr:uncharacterized protein MONBRDRAFT_22866 [Monosiga brevicollis MX1]EDQ91749.1 predicted protein [Monosiga brevicollis MX1]|eukprot:XP_001743035.1 hypothetical protein [Monosiga brevicollis MX1]